MNKAFYRPLIIIVTTIIFLGIIAAVVPGMENKVFNIKPFKWLGHLKDLAAKKTLVDVVALSDSLKIASNLSAMEICQKRFAQLISNPSNSIRIAYFGDSIIEGDLITGQLRHNLQSKYGGTGVGFMPITSIVANFRQTIRHSFSKNWEVHSFMTHNSTIPLGISGFVFIPRNYYTIEKAVETEQDTLISVSADSTSVKAPLNPPKETQRYYVDTPSWVRYQAADVIGGAANFENIRLFYSHAKPESYIIIHIDNQEPKKVLLNPGENLQTLTLNNSKPVKSLKLEFNPYDPIHVYGVSFDKNTGVYVDNFSIRGYSGMFFQRIPKDLLSSFNNILSYDLIILQYGENVSNPKFKTYDFYYTGMVKTIKHLQEAMPNIPILMISAHDRSIKQDGKYVTSPDIPFLVNTQGEIAKATNSAFWNLYDAMGGVNSMANFVNSTPPKASKDYTHFNRNGANYIGNLLTDVILNKK